MNLVRKEVDTALEDFLAEHRERTEQSQMARVVTLITEFMEGGKRIRPILTVMEWKAVGAGKPARNPSFASRHRWRCFTRSPHS
ncbi:hypothetical protein [Streptomyces sp. NPDC052036]|uniref:hypothetical protein n=1 Tax=Streptomyces sp. NPDC052036 TaxID=3155171 RepID=UPI00344659B9